MLIDVCQSAVKRQAPRSIRERETAGDPQTYDSSVPFLSRHWRNLPPAAAGVVDVVEEAQELGWFTPVAESAQVASSLTFYWRQNFGIDVEAEESALAWRVLAWDAARGLTFDIDAGIREGDSAYADFLWELERISGKGFGGVVDPVENWRSGKVELTFRWKRRKQRIVVPADGRFHPSLVTAFNDVLPEDGPLFWFAAVDPPHGVIFRATDQERRLIEARLQLPSGLEPPEWWSPSAVSNGEKADRDDPTLDTESAEDEGEWIRHETDEAAFRGVSVTRQNATLLTVTVALAEFVREDPLESEMRRRVELALRSVPGVTNVGEEDREVWFVRGSALAPLLGEAVSQVVDDLAERARPYVGGL